MIYSNNRKNREEFVNCFTLMETEDVKVSQKLEDRAEWGHWGAKGNHSKKYLYAERCTTYSLSQPSRFSLWVCGGSLSRRGCLSRWSAGASTAAGKSVIRKVSMQAANQETTLPVGEEQGKENELTRKLSDKVEAAASKRVRKPRRKGYVVEWPGVAAGG